MSNSVQLGGIYEEGYGIVPKKMFKAKNIGKHEKLILSYFLSYTGAGKDSCFPSINLICEDLELSKGTVVQAIKNCVSEGFIRKEKLHPDNPLNHANKYVLLFGNTDSSMVRTSKVQTSDGSSFRLTEVHPVEHNNNSINNNNNNTTSSDDGVPSSSPSSLIRQEDSVDNKANALPTPPPKKVRPPSPEKSRPKDAKEVTEYAASIGFKLDGDYFIDYNTSRGWVYGKNTPIRDWKAMVRTWSRQPWNKKEEPAKRREEY